MFSTFRRLSSSINGNNRNARAEYEAFQRKRGPNVMLKAGIPLVLLVVAGSLFLSNFVTTQVEMKDKNNSATNEKEFTLEEEHRKLLKKLDIENYSLSRIPRPEEVIEKEKQKDQTKK
jgi:DNA-directed RNA polymerase subunit H (RpoH/RPB5)